MADDGVADGVVADGVVDDGDVPGVALPGPRAVLFDVDGTLATGSSDHLAALATTAARELGVDARIRVVAERPRLGDVDVTGWIDAQVWRLLLERAVRDPHDATRLRALVDRYAADYADALARGTARPGTLVPGAAGVLDRLAAGGVPVALVTGNAHAVARAKLARSGIGEAFAYDRDAGFGDWRGSRAALAPAAMAALSVRPGPDVWLVGDTVADMAGARAAGVTGIGVLTGGDDGAALRAAGAVVVLPSVAGLPLGPGRADS